MAVLLRIVTVALAAALLPVEVAAQAPGALLKVVVVSRHGVRTPIVASDELATWSKNRWPAWPEARGNLTAQGEVLATRLGEWYRLYAADQNLLPPQGCPPAGSVFVYADVFERTLVTGRGLASGLAPGCKLAVESKLPSRFDGVFHPIDAKVCRIDPKQADAAIQARAGGDISPVASRFPTEFTALQETLGCCRPKLCIASGLRAGCTLPEVPTKLVPQLDGSGVALQGALAIGSSAAEIFLLEYANGKPPDQVAWDRAPLPKIMDMLAVHDAAFDLMQRTPYLAKRLGSSLLARTAAAVTGQAVAGVAPVPGSANAKFVAFVGHDTNIANLSGMLDATWLLPGYQANATPPAGALVFEVRAGGAGPLVYLSYLAQTPDQMRGATRLTLAAPPLRQPVRIPACSSDAAGFPCTLEAFAKAVSTALEPECIARK